MPSKNDVLILRDQQGNFYAIDGQTVQAGKVPANKQQALQQAISGEVSGYFFNVGAVQGALTGLSQGNTNTANNVAFGGIVGFNQQDISQLGVNIGQAGTSQTQV